MKKIIILAFTIFSLFLAINFFEINNNNLIAVYIDNIENTNIPDKNSNYIIDKIICDNEAAATWDNINWSLLVTNLSKRSNCKLYFHSKKDITVTYDNNYIKENIFENIYQSSTINRNCITASKTTVNIQQINDYKHYKFTSNGEENNIEWSSGLFMYSTTPLTVYHTYTIQFEAKGNEDYTAYIGSEQMINQYELINSSKILKNWSKYSYSFSATSNNKSAFIFYGWLAKNEERILEVRNLSLQEGEYDNYTTISLKEYDNLNNTLPTPTRDNYTFLGWYTDPIEGEKISSETIVTEDTTYYAHWQYNE